MTDSEKTTADSRALDEFIEKANLLFDKEAVEAAARRTGFVQRESELSGHLFLTVFAFGMSVYGEPTLEQLISLMKTAVPEFDISRSGLHQRINERAVDFFEFALSKAIQLRVPSNFNLNSMKKFESVLIIDSTSFQVPRNLENIFPGSGGKASGAAVKIQFGYDLKKARFFYLLQEGNRPDNCERNGFLEEIRPGDLIIRDLGYFSTKSFKEIDDKNAYYLSRLKSDTAIYLKDETGNVVKKDLTEIVKDTKCTLREFEISIKSGKDFTPARLAVEKVPEAIYSERLRKINENHRKKGRTVSDRVKLCASVNLYISNAPPDFLPAERFRPLYGVRWQIEIVFKNWKTNFNLDKVTGFREERIKCMIYAKLLFIFIVSHIVLAIKNYIWQTCKSEVSEFRACRQIKTYASEWFRLILQNPDEAGNFLKRIGRDISGRCRKIKQKNRVYPLELLEQILLA